MAERTAAERKNSLRRLYKEKREALSFQDTAFLDNQISAVLFATEEYRGASQILLYASVNREVDTRQICSRAVSDGKHVFFPRCEGEGKMTFYRAEQFPSAAGAYAIPEPEPGEEYYPGKRDLCLVPGLAFDLHGFRLGYGKGFYDRFLPAFPGVCFGLCRAAFLAETLPADVYDRRVDGIVTENGFFSAR